MQKYFYIAIFLIAAGCCLFIAAKTAHASSLNNVDTSLAQLEDRFFEHQYDADADVDRLARLEQLVFGSTQTGSVNDRLKHLMATIPADDQNTDAGAGALTNSSSSSASNGRLNARAETSPAPTQNNIASAKPAPKPTFDYGSYPRVTNLEQELLGHTYPNDDLQDRLARLEAKAYGAPSSSTDLCERVDLLDDYAQRHDLYGDHKSVSPPVMAFNPTTPISSNSRSNVASAPSMGSRAAAYQNPWDTPAQQTQTEYTSKDGTFIGSAEERISMMEAQVFRRTYTDKTVDERLTKLEKKILPSENIANLSETAQTVKLWDTLHPNEANQVAVLADNDTGPAYNSDSAGNTQASPNPSKKGSWLHRLATSGGSSILGTSMSPNANMQPTTYGTNNGYIPGMFPSNSRFVGASVGPGAGPAGLPVGFW